MSLPPFRACTFNVKGFLPMRPRKQWADVQMVAGVFLLIGWQEQWWQRYRKVIRHVLGRHYAHSLASGNAGTGISWHTSRFRKRWRFNHPLHGPVPFVCSARYFTGAVLRDRETGRDRAVMSAHLSPWRGGLGKNAQAEGLARLVRFAAHHVNMGRDVTIFMDGNCRRHKVRAAFGPTLAGARVEIAASPATGIDYIVNVGRDHVSAAENLDGQNSDHAPMFVTVQPV